MSDDIEDIVHKFVSLNEEEENRSAMRPRRRRVVGLWTKVFVAAAALIMIASAGLAAVVLFTQTPTYTHSGLVSMGCPAPTGAANGTLILYTCSGLPSMRVSSSAAGFVRYGTYTVPSNVTDVYLVDTAAPATASCTSWASPGNGNMILSPSGGQFTLGSGAGKLQPSHSYNYCVDFSSEPPTFSFSITWTEG